MTISADQMSDIAERALERAESYRKALREQMQGLGPGQRNMSALEHKDWFEMHAIGWWEEGEPQIDPATGQPQIDPMTGQPIPSRRFKDGPNWVRALEFVDGGKKERQRYMKTVERIASGELREQDGTDF